MSVELHIISFGNFFVDGAFGGVQVGQAYEPTTVRGSSR